MDAIEEMRLMDDGCPNTGESPKCAPVLSENRPLPWKAVEFDGIWRVTNDAGDPRDEYDVFEYATEGEAKFIALACNSYHALLAENARLKTLPDWLIGKLKTLGEYYEAPTDGRDVVGEIQGWMHVLCFHYVQNRREVREYDAARRKAKELEAESERLRAGLREALAFVAPDTRDLVSEFSDLDGTALESRRRCAEIRGTRERLAALLANTGGAGANAPTAEG